MGKAVLWCRRGLLPIAKSGICTRWRVNCITPAIPADCSIPSGTRLVAQGFVLMQYMTQSILVNTAKGTLKAKRNRTSFNWCLGRHNQRTISLLNWWGMNLTEKSELNNPQILITSGYSYRNNLLSTASLRWKECRESVKWSKGIIWWMKRSWFLWVFFRLIWI